jgi:hypothetical protein
MIGYASLGKPIWEIDSYRQKWANKANFAETTSIVEAQESIQLTANSGAVSGLDKRVAGPGEGSTPEPGEARGSAIETTNSEFGRNAAMPPRQLFTTAPKPSAGGAGLAVAKTHPLQRVADERGTRRPKSYNPRARQDCRGTLPKSCNRLQSAATLLVQWLACPRD